MAMEILTKFGLRGRFPIMPEELSTEELIGLGKLLSLAYCGIEAVLKLPNTDPGEAMPELEMIERDLKSLATLALAPSRELEDKQREGFRAILSDEHPVSEHG